MGMDHRERLLTALTRGIPDRVPFSPFMLRWTRYHYGCTCPYHQLKVMQEFDLDLMVYFGHYTWQTVTNDYIYTPAGGYSYAAAGLYGDLPDVDVDIRIENRAEEVWFYRTFRTPAGQLNDVLQWARPNLGYGDGPNPHRVEPLIKSEKDLDALRFLYPEPRRDLLADLPILLEEIGNRALVAAYDNTHAGIWGLEPLGEQGKLIACIENPQLLKAVARFAQDVHKRNLSALLERGLKVVFDSWSLASLSVGWSPQAYREIFLPLLKETVEFVHGFGALYVYQDDGRIREIAADIVAAGIDVLSGLQPPPIGDLPLAEAKELYGKKVGLMGGLDPCYNFDLGKPELVQQAVRQAIIDAADGGGYAIGTAEGIAPETPAESLRAGVETVRSCGVYGGDLR